MGFFKQGNNVFAWGVIGKVFEPTVAKTKKGNVQVVKFNVNVDTDEKGDKVWALMECWGANAQNSKIKQWNTALVGGKYMVNKYTDRLTGEEKKSRYVRAEFLQIDETSGAFDNIAKSKEDTPKNDTPVDLKDEGNGDLPF